MVRVPFISCIDEMFTIHIKMSLKIPQNERAKIRTILDIYRDRQKKAWLFAKLQLGRARKRIKAT